MLNNLIFIIIKRNNDVVNEENKKKNKKKNNLFKNKFDIFNKVEEEDFNKLKKEKIKFIFILSPRRLLISDLLKEISY